MQRVRRPAVARTAVVAVTALALFAAGAAQAVADPASVLPPQARAHGLSRSQLAAQWWQWALSQPVSTNPILDATGAQCANDQTGHVWFLAGEPAAAGPLTRHCTIPTGTDIFFPVINGVYCAGLTDPADQRTEKFVRSQLAYVANSTHLLVTLDGQPVADPSRFYEQSVL